MPRIVPEAHEGTQRVKQKLIEPCEAHLKLKSQVSESLAMVSRLFEENHDDLALEFLFPLVKKHLNPGTPNLETEQLLSFLDLMQNRAMSIDGAQKLSSTLPGIVLDVMARLKTEDQIRTAVSTLNQHRFGRQGFTHGANEAFNTLVLKHYFFAKWGVTGLKAAFGNFLDDLFNPVKYYPAPEQPKEWDARVFAYKNSQGEDLWLRPGSALAIIDGNRVAPDSQEDAYDDMRLAEKFFDWKFQLKDGLDRGTYRMEDFASKK